MQPRSLALEDHVVPSGHRHLRTGRRANIFVFRLFLALVRTAIVLAVIAGGVFVGGFVRFANDVTAGNEVAAATNADGIVVLTGGSARIARALELLEAGKGKRLLISGVNPATDIEALKKINPDHSALFNCCIDLESEAQNTVGNALAAKQWSTARDYGSLIVVTSGYHMPRSLMEFRRHLPDTVLNAHSVVLAHPENGEWWTDGETLRLLISEYVKYSGAWSRDYLNANLISLAQKSLGK